MTIYGQLEFLRNADLGFNKDQLLAIYSTREQDIARTHATLKVELSRVTGVVAVAQSDFHPRWVARRSSYIFPSRPQDERIIIWENGVSHDYMATMGMTIIAGSDFTPGMQPLETRDDNGEIVRIETPAIITESLTRKLGFAGPNAAIGQELRLPRTPYLIARRVAGVVKDVEFGGGVRDPMAEIFFLRGSGTWDGRDSSLLVRLSPAGLASTLDAIDAAWSSIEPDDPIRRVFVDELFEFFNRQSERLFNFFRLGIGISICVSAMGLFGLAAISSRKRTKEVGIRKAGGASTSQIVRLMTWDLTKPVLWANCIAWPAAYLALDRWLDTFSMRIELSVFTFLVAGAATLLVAWGVVAIHVVRTAQTHPSQALRYE